MNVHSQNSQSQTSKNARHYADTCGIAALILAGGSSSRMGRDKALIPWDGVPLLQCVGEVAASCCPQVYVLAPREREYQNWLDDRYLFLEESNPGQGPLAALTEGLERLQLDNPAIAWVLLLACDLPQLDSRVLQRWSAQLPHLPPTTLALVPRHEDLWQPLCGFYRASAHSSLVDFMQKGERSFQSWLSRGVAESLSLAEAEAKMLLNCNQPGDVSE
ncbi:MAG: molybdenum cofactor guanylyltransferase [Cyanobacteriota bacterium]|nr:molybdenum cofactor guanylyltransferase [Cyanobacteriota bacterium]